MDAEKFDVCALAQRTIDAALDAPIVVARATIPMQVSEFVDASGDARSFQVLSADAGLFLIVWRIDNSFGVFDINNKPIPLEI